MMEETTFYVDCEFNEHGGELLSLALVEADGRGLYLCVADEPASLTPWVRENVWPLVHSRLPVGRTVAYVADWGHFLRRYIGSTTAPTFIADSPVDIARLAGLLSDDGGKWVSVDNPEIRFEVHNVDCYPTDVPGAIQHNAWWDAMALRAKLSEAVPA